MSSLSLWESEEGWRTGNDTEERHHLIRKTWVILRDKNPALFASGRFLTFSPLTPGGPAAPRSPGMPPGPWCPGPPAAPAAPGSPWIHTWQTMVHFGKKLTCFYKYTLSYINLTYSDSTGLFFSILFLWHHLTLPPSDPGAPAGPRGPICPWDPEAPAAPGLPRSPCVNTHRESVSLAILF